MNNTPSATEIWNGRDSVKIEVVEKQAMTQPTFDIDRDTKQWSAHMIKRVQELEQQRDELQATLKNIWDCVFMADDNAAGLGHDADGSIRRHLAYAMAIINKAQEVQL